MGKNRTFAVGGIAIVAWIGCGARTREPAQVPAAQHDRSAYDAPVHNAVDSTQHRLQLIARAEQALAERWPLDYRRPFTDAPYAETAAKELYLDACREGDKPSCWAAATLGGWSDGGPARARVLENCRAGDVMSCRALPGGEGFSELPGWAGRSQECRDPWPGHPCDLVVLRRECLEGFAFSCWRIALQRDLPDSPDRDALIARFVPLVREGCRARIKDECVMLGNAENISAADDQLSDEQMCPLTFTGCRWMSNRYRRLGDVLRARDLAERVCQYERERTECVLLGEEYVTGLFQEPVRGRGEALIAWGCDTDLMRQDHPTCKARATKHTGAPSKKP